MHFPKRVFLIDDDEEDRFIFGLALESFEHHIEYHSAEGGETVLQLLSLKSMVLPDLIFLDRNLPKLSSSQVVTAIRKMPGYASIPIIIYSDSSPLENTEMLRQLGASHFLAKPSNFAELQKELQALFILTGNSEG